MEPFLRRTDRGQLAPVGWVSEPAGLWGDHQVDVVFDPHQHQVVMLRAAHPAALDHTLGERGFRRVAVDGQQQLWVCGIEPIVDHQPAVVTARQGSLRSLFAKRVAGRADERSSGVGL